MEEIKIEKKVEPVEISFGMIMGVLAGLVIGIITGITIMLVQTDNDREEKDCVEFYNKNNYITEKCEIYKDKLEKSKKND